MFNLEILRTTPFQARTPISKAFLCHAIHPLKYDILDPPLKYGFAIVTLPESRQVKNKESTTSVFQTCMKIYAALYSAIRSPIN